MRLPLVDWGPARGFNLLKRLFVRGMGVLLAALSLACVQKSPAAPSLESGLPSSSSPGHVVTGQTVSALTGQAIPGVTIRLKGGALAASDSQGYFRAKSSQTGRLSSTVSGEGIVERQTAISVPGPHRILSLIPVGFDLAAFDQMARGTQARLQRWTTAPTLIVQTATLVFTSSMSDQFNSLADQMTDAEVARVTDDLTWGLAQLTGNTFTAFAAVRRESAPAASSVSTNRMGAIVFARYQGLERALGGPGAGRWAYREDGTVIAGVIFVDRDVDAAGDHRRRSGRVHELGHALGYTHVTSRSSIMNPSADVDLTDFDREAAIVAFRRPPGNRAPDVDPANVSSAFSDLTRMRPVSWTPAIR